MDDWLKISEWRYVHATESLAIEHDSDGWKLLWTKAGSIWPSPFATVEEAMEFAGCKCAGKRALGLVRQEVRV